MSEPNCQPTSNELAIDTSHKPALSPEEWARYLDGENPYARPGTSERLIDLRTNDPGPACRLARGHGRPHRCFASTGGMTT